MAEAIRLASIRALRGAGPDVVTASSGASCMPTLAASMTTWREEGREGGSE
jgi:hypothetical protein